MAGAVYNTETMKIILFGDSEIGKTSLLLSYRFDYFPGNFITSFPCDLQTTIDNRPVYLRFSDICGHTSFDANFAQVFKGADLILLCFSLIDQQSFENAKGKWMDRIRLHAPKLPIILVGLKQDLKQSAKVFDQLAAKNQRAVGYVEAKWFGDDIGAFAYVECSAKTRYNLYKVFETAVRAVRTARYNAVQINNKKCIIL